MWFIRVVKKVVGGQDEVLEGFKDDDVGLFRLQV